MRILIMEDDQRIISFLKRGLEAEQHTVDLAFNIRESLELIASRAYDVIMIDVYLGEHNGLAICENLRSAQITTPILLMTAKDSHELRLSARGAGANAYLPKPFSFDELLSVMTQISQGTIHSESFSPTLGS